MITPHPRNLNKNLFNLVINLKNWKSKIFILNLMKWWELLENFKCLNFNIYKDSKWRKFLLQNEISTLHYKIHKVQEKVNNENED